MSDLHRGVFWIPNIEDLAGSALVFWIPCDVNGTAIDGCAIVPAFAAKSGVNYNHQKLWASSPKS